jgi:diguanylate cyclase (GGDEF)-like protein/PAS domain S-box-containing protein
LSQSFQSIRGGALIGQMLSRNRSIRYLIACGLLFVTAIAVVTTLTVENFKNRALADSQRELKNTALILSQQIDRSFQAIELVEKSVAVKVQSLGIASSEDFVRNMSRQDVQLMLKASISGLEQANILNIVSANGDVISSSGNIQVPTVNIADREHFVVLKSNEQLTTYMSRPVVSRTDGSWTLYQDRKLTAANGKFLGVVTGAITLSYFEKLFGAVELGDGSSITLYQSDGMLLARYPRIDSVIGQYFKFPRAALGDGDSGTARFTGAMEGKDRLLAVHRIAHFPMYVSVAVDVGTALADWRNETNILLGVGGLAAITVIGVILLIVQHLYRDQKASNRRLELERERLDTAINNMPQGLLMFDASGKLVVCNRRYIEMYGLSPDVIKPGCSLHDVILQRKATGSFSGDVDTYCSRILDGLAQGASEEIIETEDGCVIRRKDQPVATGGWVTTHTDITERTKIERERDHSREFLNEIINRVPTAIIVKDIHSLRYVLVNAAAEKYFDASSDHIIGKTAHQLWPSAAADLIADQDKKLLQSDGYLSFDEHRFETPGKGSRIFTSKRIIVRDGKGEPQYVLGVMEDVTESKLANERIVHMAHYDALTDLPNRVLFREQLEQALKWIHRGEQVAVLYLDLDHFKTINDSLGHTVGDELLKAVAGRLNACLRDVDIVARLGGDEFAIIQAAVKVPADVTDLATRVFAALKPPFEVNGHQLIAETSIGIAVAPNDGVDSDQLLKNADLAMYGAKAEGRGVYRFFEPDMDTRVKARRALEFDLRQAVQRFEFELHYQPLVNLQDNSITGCEALLRWRHPERGMVSPADFIPVAEETGLIVSIGEWVLRTACAQATSWPDNIKIAVNVSPVQFKSGGFVELVVNALAISGLAPQRLELEITEAVLIHDDAKALALLHQLRELGVRIAMDDFGTGYSSLSYLQRFPFDKIKIDQSFIKGVEESVGQQSIVQAVMTIAKTRNMTTTAEGVETELQRDILLTLGCTELQGYLFSPPISAAKVTELIFSRRKIDAWVA